MEKPTDDIKRRLKAVWFFRQRILSDVQRLKELRSIAEQMTPKLTGMPSGTNQQGSRMEKAVADLLEHEQMIKREVVELEDCIQETRQCIDQLPVDSERAVLELRYITGMKFEQICGVLQYSWPHVIRLHGMALMHLAKLEKEKDETE